MSPWIRILTLSLLVAPQVACATYWQAKDLEEKIDLLVKNTNRETMSAIFGEQASAINSKMDSLSGEEKQKLDTLIEGYQRGNTSLEEVRSSVLGTLGGSDRVVANPRGMWVRDEEGKRTKAIGANATIKKCALISEDDLPAAITQSKGLAQFKWGRGEVNGKVVLFPWELTMSSFTKEIVENSARRTAQEILKMAGDKGWNRPVHIQVVTEPGQNLKVNVPGAENEVFVTGEQPAGQAPQPAPQGNQ